MVTQDDRPLIFISHLTANGESARLLQNFLERRFLGAFQMFNTSERSTLAPGDTWMTRIFEALKSASFLLAILTPESVRSPWVNFECGAAWLGGAKVVPCCGGALTKGKLPQPYGTLQAIDLSNEVDLDSLMRLIERELSFSPPEISTAQLADDISASFLRTDAVDRPSRVDGSRRDRRVYRRWRFERSKTDPFRWSADYLFEADFEVLQRDLEEIDLSFTPALEAIPFQADSPPDRELLSFSRSSPGAVHLAEPHRRTGSSFAFKVKFSPPLRQGDEAQLAVHIHFPQYHLGTREELAQAQLQNGTELSDYRYSGRSVNLPTDEFIYEIVIPKNLGAIPAEPAVRRFGSRFEQEEEFLVTSGAFSISEIDVDGEPCWLMRIHRFDPPRDAAYRLRWQVPSRTTVAALNRSEPDIA